MRQGVQSRQLGGAVDVKHQHAPRRDEQMEPLKTFLHILRMQKIIQTVQTANGGVHRPVEVQLRHILVQEHRQTFFERQAERKKSGEEEP